MSEHEQEPAPAPLWSVMIPTYNCANFLGRTLRTVLAQDPGPDKMQIEVVDDCSTADDPESIVRAVSGSRVDFYRQDRNQGHVHNFNTCLQRARGQLLHLLHGDDFVYPGFYARMERVFAEYPKVGAAFCRNDFVDEADQRMGSSELEQAQDGELPYFLSKIAVSQRLQFVALVVRTECYQQVGDFKPFEQTEDWEMYVRLAARFPFYYVSEPLAAYRIHSEGRSSVVRRTAKNIYDEKAAIEEFNGVLPGELRERLRRQALNRLARWALTLARGYAGKTDHKAAFNNIKAALHCRVSPVTLLGAAEVGLRVAYHHQRRFLREKLKLGR